MTLRNSTPLPGLILLLLSLGSCSDLATKNHPPLVFALNLSPVSVSLALVHEGAVLVDFSNLAPMESQRFTRIEASNDVVLRQGAGGQAPVNEWTDPSGTPYALRFQEGHLYAVIVDPKGQAALYSLPETYSSDPKIGIVNVTDRTLAQVQAAPDWAKNVKLYAQDLVPVVPSEFYSVEPKVLGMYWQTLAQAGSGAHTTALDALGKPLRQTFEPNHYYLFLAGDGAVRDVTPTLD